MLDLTFGGASFWLIHSYMERLEATRIFTNSESQEESINETEAHYEYNGTRVLYKQGEPHRVGTFLTMKQVDMTVEAIDQSDAQAAADLEKKVMDKLYVRLMRAGG